MKKNVIGLSFVVSFIFGAYFGMLYKEHKFTKVQLENSIRVEQLVQAQREAEAEHKNRENQLLEELVQARNTYEKNISSIRDDYDSRLLESSRRIDYYRKQSNSSLGCTQLATHTGKLDGSLEEGRSLVKQLREVIIYQQNRINYLNEVIKNDRELVNE